MGIADVVSSGLKIKVWPFLEIAVDGLSSFLAGVAVLDAQCDDFFRRLRVCQVNGWGAVELDVLGWEVLSYIEHVTLHTK